MLDMEEGQGGRAGDKVLVLGGPERLDDVVVALKGRAPAQRGDCSSRHVGAAGQARAVIEIDD